ncbi:MATH domain protein [Opisthorchis viverrini]|uniref:Uncharacterized protein n=2 Tax=Opisthorchis viverrini TaxID=6198 RepID=A0A075A0I3_OPIVI|nr:hypothetical protein T265_04245 [Opisthorchis viverrini]KER29060.1 hypothetical protein T265_04245 [Opisthorchis viverrini]OON19454.1 MATH domain protein [Opisthorchis viverrini]
MGGGETEVTKPEHVEDSDKDNKDKAKKKSKKKSQKEPENASLEQQPQAEGEQPDKDKTSGASKKKSKRSHKENHGEATEEQPGLKAQQSTSEAPEAKPEKPAAPTTQIAKTTTETTAGSTGPSGSEILFVDPLDDVHKCISCGNALRVPILFEDCGHRCCSSCLPNVLRGSSKCPADNTHLKQDHIKLDKDFQLQMDELAVRCTFEPGGCTWTGKLAQLGGHLSHCGFRVITCPNDCGVEFEQRYLETHVSNDCPKRSKKCKFCDASLIAANELKHIGVCPRFPVTCPNDCKKRDIPRCQLAEHLATECSKQDLPCPFEPHGCEFLGRKKKTEVHLTECHIEHLNMVNSSMQQMTLLLEAQTKSFTELKSMLTQQAKRLTALERCFGSSFTWKIDNYAEKFSMAKSGKQTTLFSPPFYTHRCGYRMAVSVCLYGSGDCRGKFMSVFVCLCRGEHDTVLSWPFTHQLTFTLLDQHPDVTMRKPVDYTIKPNAGADQTMFLGRPTAERNPCFGAPRFMKLEALKNSDYIFEDCIFLKITMNLDEVPAI